MSDEICLYPTLRPLVMLVSGLWTVITFAGIVYLPDWRGWMYLLHLLVLGIFALVTFIHAYWQIKERKL